MIRRRISALVLGLMSVFVLAGPVLADTVPGPGNYRDSGRATYLNAWGSECSRTTCTDTYVYAANVNLQSGDAFAYVCFDQFTYPLKGGQRFHSLYGCADVGPTIASDLSSASIDATIVADSCSNRTCTTVDVSLSLSLTAISDPIAYSYTSKSQYGTCSDSYRVRGEASDAEGILSVNGSSVTAFGQIGAETFAFSSRCR